MEFSSSTAKWLYSFVYITFISGLLFSIHTQIAPNLLIGHQPITLKKTNPSLPLRFRDDGTFKILQVADMHYGNGISSHCQDVFDSDFYGCSDHNTSLFLMRMIEAENPDFIAFTGDNVYGRYSTDAAESMIRAFRPATESGIPWAAVLGNHDQESTMTREELMFFISLMDYSVSQVNPLAEDPLGEKMQDIDGFGNYDHRVYGAPGSYLANSSILNLFFLDSGDREIVNGVQTYGWIKESQLHWLLGVSQSHSRDPSQSNKNFPSGKPPALAFFHIPIPEVRQLRNKHIIGEFQQRVSCSPVNSGVFQTLVSMGDVKAVFVGHDHTNDFCGNLDGVWLCYGGGFGYHGYGKTGWPRRGRVILAELGKGSGGWMGVEKIKTWKRLDDEKLSKIDEQVLWENHPPQ